MENIDIDIQEIDIQNVDSVLTGPQGIQGIPGVSPTVTVGTTTTLPPDTPATVTNSGTPTDLVLDFGIPEGSPANCLSVPTIVESLPETGNPNTFYFVPRYANLTTDSGDSFTITTTNDGGRFKSVNVNGVLEQSLDNITVMAGESTVTVNSDTYTLDLGDIALAKVNTTKDYIYREGNLWKVHKAIGKIDSYNGETITTDYVSSTGSLTTGAEVYYVLETPVEVTIEDEELTDTLNQIISSPLPTGSNTMSITNTDVTPDLTISYYDYEENNQYRKYVYIIDSSNFEEI